MTSFVLSDVISQLRASGIVNANAPRVHYLIQMGRLPKPQLDSSNRFIFTQAHIDRLRELLAEMPSARSRCVPHIT